MQYSRKLNFSKQNRQRTRFRENCDVLYSEKHAPPNNVYSSITLTKTSRVSLKLIENAKLPSIRYYCHSIPTLLFRSLISDQLIYLLGIIPLMFYPIFNYKQNIMSIHFFQYLFESSNGAILLGVECVH